MLTAEAADEPDAEPTLAAAVVYFGVFGPPTLSLVYLTPRTVTIVYCCWGGLPGVLLYYTYCIVLLY